ncbi:hypothetical protein GCM10025795_41250 [Verticiella sediminum]
MLNTGPQLARRWGQKVGPARLDWHGCPRAAPTAKASLRETTRRWTGMGHAMQEADSTPRTQSACPIGELTATALGLSWLR